MHANDDFKLFPSKKTPSPKPLLFNNWNNVLLLSPHADDEALACGGLISYLGDSGITLHAVLVSDSNGAGGLPQEAGMLRQNEFISSIKTLHQHANVILWGLPDGRINEFHETTVGKIINITINHSIDTIIAPWPMDMHPDHSAVGYAVIEAAKKRIPSLRRICFFEVWSPLPATHILDISTQWQRKLRALHCHATALSCGNYERAMHGLASYRSLLTPRMASDNSYAEAFYLIETSSSHEHTTPSLS